MLVQNEKHKKRRNELNETTCNAMQDEKKPIQRKSNFNVEFVYASLTLANRKHLWLSPCTFTHSSSIQTVDYRSNWNKWWGIILCPVKLNDAEPIHTHHQVYSHANVQHHNSILVPSHPVQFSFHIVFVISYKYVQPLRHRWYRLNKIDLFWSSDVN